MSAPKQFSKAVIGHIGIEVSNIARSKKFYHALLGKLGFEVILDDESAVGLSNQAFQVWLAKPQKPRVKRKSPIEEEFIVADHLAILVQDKATVDIVNKMMETRGYKPLFPCEEHPEFAPGYYAVSFSDPDNYVVEVYTRPSM
jgi:catechol 2,3-dioxygenase-like lactoylglutathione lyase family enzyme